MTGGVRVITVSRQTVVRVSFEMGKSAIQAGSIGCRDKRARFVCAGGRDSVCIDWARLKAEIQALIWARNVSAEMATDRQRSGGYAKRACSPSRSGYIFLVAQPMMTSDRSRRRPVLRVAPLQWQPE
ncbi:hypothetical protein MTO96_002932 [Rhipicephalus appendiculatus]